ncbi:MAG TPA: hypothetical protein VE913_15865, partial [Longimicrobium sp.]|nr:hypothetical protein [Longimicrobium sp.]
MGRRWFRYVLAGMLTTAAACAESPTGGPARLAPTGPALRAVEAYAGRIRIGVIPSATSIKIGATTSYEVREKGTNTLLTTGAANELLTVTYDPAASVTTTSRLLQVVCTSSTADRDQRLANGTAAGFPTASEFVSTANCWRVYVGERPLPIDTAAERIYKDRVIAAGQATSAAVWKTVTLARTLPRYRVTRGTGTQYLAAEAPRITPASGVVIIGTQQYRGTAEVQINSASVP